MLSSWQESMQELKKQPSPQSMNAVPALCNDLKHKKVLNKIKYIPTTDAERDALSKQNQQNRLRFLHFTTALDILTENELEVTFTQYQGLACWPVAHTCGPTLEIPATYSNYVEFREDFMNVLGKDNWEIDIV